MKKVLLALGIKQLEAALYKSINKLDDFEVVDNTIHKDGLIEKMKSRDDIDLVITIDSLTGYDQENVSEDLLKTMQEVRILSSKTRVLLILDGSKVDKSFIHSLINLGIYDFLITENSLTLKEILNLVEKPNAYADIVKFLPQARAGLNKKPIYQIEEDDTYSKKQVIPIEEDQEVDTQENLSTKQEIGKPSILEGFRKFIKKDKPSMPSRFAKKESQPEEIEVKPRNNRIDRLKLVKQEVEEPKEEVSLNLDLPSPVLTPPEPSPESINPPIQPNFTQAPIVTTPTKPKISPKPKKKPKPKLTQNRDLRTLVRVNKIIGYFGLSEGLGTTSLCFGEALELSRDYKVLYIELNEETPSLPIRLDLFNDSYGLDKIFLNLQNRDAIDMRINIDKSIIKNAYTNLDFLFFSKEFIYDIFSYQNNKKITKDNVNLEDIGSLLSEIMAMSEYDFILLDGLSLNHKNREAVYKGLLACHEVNIVINQDPAVLIYTLNKLGRIYSQGFNRPFSYILNNYNKDNKEVKLGDVEDMFKGAGIPYKEIIVK